MTGKGEREGFRVNKKGGAQSEQKSGKNIFKNCIGRKTNQGNAKGQITGKMRKGHYWEIPIRDGKRKMRR